MACLILRRRLNLQAAQADRRHAHSLSTILPTAGGDKRRRPATCPQTPLRRPVFILSSWPERPFASFRSSGTFPLDRKSTRLNSRHHGISYAVFCLQQKKQNEDTTNPMTNTIQGAATPGKGVT